MIKRPDAPIPDRDPDDLDDLDLEPGALFESGDWFVNRQAIVVRPRRPFIDWLNRIEKSRGLAKTSLAEARTGPAGFLVPSFPYHERTWAWVRENCEAIFAIALEDWVLDEELWPPDLSWERLEKWFDLELIDGLVDLVDDELTVGIWDDLDDLDDLGDPDPEVLRAVVLEVVDNQLSADEPPIVRETLQRLMAGGRTREEAREMIADVLNEEMLDIVMEGRPHDPDRYRRRLEGLEA